MRSTVSLVAALLMSTAASALNAPSELPTQESSASLDLAAWPSSLANVFTMKLDGRTSVHRNVSIEVEMPASAGHLFGDPASHAAFGNVTVGALGSGVLHSPRGPIVLFGGLFLTVPTTYGFAATNEAIGSASIQALAAASRGLDDIESYLPEFGFIRLLFGIDLEASPWRLRSEVALRLAVGLGDDTRKTPVTADLEAAVELEVRLPNGFDAGIRAQEINSETLATGVVAIEPFVGFERADNHFFARASYMVSSAGLLLPPYDGIVASTATVRLGVRF